ncbi:SHOCT domain-containing protein [Paeniglutamicibacter sp. NPDC012692]|uniref:SHOCT domain-containing protein n=1 Tax=Paeniglutamicibacter sp. NPDC012692 TaxID=3364388 RepID=UPI00368DD49D
MPLLRRAGRPGLLGMAARTAVVAGTATAVSGAIQQRQINKAEAAQQEAMMQRQAIEETAINAVSGYAAPPAAPAAPPAAAPQLDLVSQLQQLGELKQQGLLNDAEFEQAKKQLMGL